MISVIVCEHVSLFILKGAPLGDLRFISTALVAQHNAVFLLTNSNSGNTVLLDVGC